METTGLVSSIQRFSIGDGPGIRTTVFLQGCPLRCAWCHNPETIPVSPALLFFENLCAGCGECAKRCPVRAHTFDGGRHIFQRTLCTACGACAENCPAGALKRSGCPMTVGEVMKPVLSDKEFYDESGGGLTLSGGEPLLQPDFAAALARESKNAGIPVIIDTSGHVPYENIVKVLPFTDEFFYDWKGVSEKDYREHTDGSFRLVSDNLKRLIRDGGRVTVRLPVIPGVSDTSEYAETAARLLKDAGVKRVCLLPFHRLAAGKYAALGLPYRVAGLEPPAKDRVLELAAIYEKHGFETRVEE